MARPQLENGFTSIANEILEKLARIHLSSNQWQVLLCIIRKTYGFHKKVDYIANFQIVEATGLCKAVVSRTLHILEDINVINRKGKFIGFQKDWEQWKRLAVQSTLVSELAELSTNKQLAIQSTKVSNLGKQLAIQSTKVSSCAVAQKIKDTITKDKRYIAYPEYPNVNKMTEDEHHKLIERFGEERTKDMVENLSLYIASKGDKYRNHYATILSWEKKDRKEVSRGQNRGHNSSRGLPKTYRSPEEIFGDRDD